MRDCKFSKWQGGNLSSSVVIAVRVNVGTISRSYSPLLLSMEGKREVYLRGVSKE